MRPTVTKSDGSESEPGVSTESGVSVATDPGRTSPPPEESGPEESVGTDVVPDPSAAGVPAACEDRECDGEQGRKKGFLFHHRS